MDKRIEYIDALRGFTIILVMLVHLDGFGFCDLACSTFFQTFRMPTFFFISGFIAYKTNIKWNISTYTKLCKKKILVQLIPTLIFGMIYVYYKINKNFFLWLFELEKYGYWFTLCLLEMFLIYYTVNLLVYKIQKENNDKIWLTCIISSVILLYAARFPLIYNQQLNIIGNITIFHHTFYYYPHFIFGVLVAKYFSLFQKYVLENKYTMASIIIFFALAYSIKENILHISFDKIDTLATIITPFMGITIVFAFFRKHQYVFSKNTKLGYVLQYIGRRTLDIYLLHYFFMSYIPHLKDYINVTTPNLLIDCLGLFVALLVIGCCLVVSNVIRLSDFLAYWLFGVKKKEESSK